MTKHIYLLIISLYVSSCTTFHKSSKNTIIESCQLKKGDPLRCIANDSLHLKYVSFGGFNFATSLQQYKKFKVKNKPHFKNIILFARSEMINIDYYILTNNEKTNPKFDYQDTIIAGNKFSVAVSKGGLPINRKFVLNGFRTVKDLN